MKRLTYAVTILIFIFFLSCKKSISITGSETMHPMMLFLSNNYMKANTNTDVDVKGGGSQVGIEELIQKQVDMAVVSRELLEDEKGKLSKNGEIEQVIIAYDGASIVVHPQNPIQSITLLQASDIFSGKITNWKDMGWNDSKIQVIIRNDNSGTAFYFKEHVLQQHDLGNEAFNQNKDLDYSSKATTVEGNSELLDIVSKDPNAIAYIGMGSAHSDDTKKVKLLSYHRTLEEEAVVPSIENVYNRKYKLSRPLYVIYYKDSKKIQDFVSFITSEKGQQAVIKSGYLRSALPEVRVYDKKE